MPLTFEQIPDADRPPTGAPASTVRKDLKATASHRRTVLRGVTLGAFTIGAAALDWSGTFGSSKARAETGPGGLQG
jgi:hypothetical protein